MSGTWTIGEATIQRIVEEERPLFDPLTFLPTLTPELLEANRDWMLPRALDPATGKLILPIQSWVLRTPHHVILVDTCIGNDKPRPAHPFWHQKRSGAWEEGLAALGLSVADIDYVLCTHLHVDHVGWNTRLEDGRWVPTFPRARYVFAAGEYAHWEAQHAKAPSPVFADSVLPVVEAGRAELVASDHAIGDLVTLEPTPGHTPGHVAIHVGRAGASRAVMSGDLIHSPIQARYPEISMRADVDPAQAAITRRRFLECHCETGTLVCTGHFPSPSAGRVSRWGEGFRIT